MSKIATIRELMVFMMARKKWWLIPIVLAFLLLSILIVLSQNSVIAPLIYTLF